MLNDEKSWLSHVNLTLFNLLKVFLQCFLEKIPADKRLTKPSAAEVSGPRSANERPGAPQRTKRRGQILGLTCFPSRLCILKHERGASLAVGSWDKSHSSLTEENLLRVNIRRVLLDFAHRGDGPGSRASRFFHLLTTFVQLLAFIKPPKTGQQAADPVQRLPAQRQASGRHTHAVLRLFWISSQTPLLSAPHAVLARRCARPASAAQDHPGVCPNHLNLNLWVDAQSTCERECQSDQVNRSSLSHCL
ncbi:hypothetical protein QQF64_000445 [Cirrhinus molitorella]|uniref:Uncharacterized protein n=1 Tax=Cirrhinus molitorella TaxID=172907 RepID=A0ABR3NX76_9TELE